MEVENQLAAASDAGGEGSVASPDTTTVDNSEAAAGGSEGQVQTPAPVSPEIEAEARSMHWVPLEDWRGDPKDWRPAEDFVRRGKEIAKTVQSRFDRQSQEFSKFKDEAKQREDSLRAEFDARLRRQEKANEKALQRQAEHIFKQFEAKKRSAVESADPVAYDRAVEEQRQALADLQSGYDVPVEHEEAPKPEPKPQAIELPPEVTDWVSRNTWWRRDRELTDAAEGEHVRLLREHPAMPLDQNLRRVDEYLRHKFPVKFGIDPQREQQPRAHSPQVEGGNRQPAGTGRARGWNDLPPEAVKAGQRFIDQGLYGEDPKKARDEYAKDYWSQE